MNELLEIKNYWVEVLLDDGSSWGCAEEGYGPVQAIMNAFDSCRRQGLKPTKAESITEE